MLACTDVIVSKSSMTLPRRYDAPSAALIYSGTESRVRKQHQRDSSNTFVACDVWAAVINSKKRLQSWKSTNSCPEEKAIISIVQIYGRVIKISVDAGASDPSESGRSHDLHEQKQGGCYDIYTKKSAKSGPPLVN